MDLNVTSLYAGALQLAGGSNGLSVTKFGWTKVPRTYRQARARRHGTADRTEFYDGRLYQISGILRGLSEADAQTRLDAFEGAIALADASFELKWRLAGRTFDEVAQVKIDGDLDYAFDAESRSVIRWALTLFAGDPRRYADVDSTLGSDVNSSTQDIFLTNDGNYPTPPRLSLICGVAVTSPAIVLMTTGERLEFDALTGGDVLVADVAARTITAGGYLNTADLTVTGAFPAADRLVAAGSTWFEIPAGGHRVMLVGQGFGEATTNLLPNGGFETNTNTWSGTAGTYAVDSLRSLHGASSMRIFPSAAGQAVIGQGAISGATAGRTFTFSVYVWAEGKAVGKTLRVQLNETGGTVGEEGVTSVDTTLVPGWQRLKVTGTVARNDRTALNCYIFDALGVLSEVPYWVDGAQLEEKAYPTAYLETDGAAATRGAPASTVFLNEWFRAARI